MFSDFSVTDPYVGLMKLEIYRRTPNATIIDVCHDLPAFNPNASGRLLQALVKDLPENTIVLAVVDPGVGTDRKPLWLEIDGRHFVGPDNGLFARIVNEANEVNAHVIEFDKTKVSASFHGRDVFAPFAANLEIDNQPIAPFSDKNEIVGLDWSIELAEIIYIDHYGNAMTGISATSIYNNNQIYINNTTLSYARTFADVKPKQVFWYVNSLGLIEISGRNSSAAKALNVKVGTPVEILS